MSHVENTVSTIVAAEKSTHMVETFVLEPLIKHPNADSLSVIKITGTDYTYVGRTEDWKDHVGKLVCWVPPDSIVDVARPEFAFLSKEGARVRAKKLRGITSYGVLVLAPEGLRAGDNAAEVLGVKHYDPETSSKNSKDFGLAPGEVASPPKGVYPKYDVDSFLKYARKVFKDGETVYVSEKLHGCLDYSTKISMADGQKQRIGKIVNRSYIGQYVLGFNSEGMVVPSKILEVHDNGKSKKWMRVKATRIGAGRGNHYSSVICTPNHKFYVNGDYISASSLKIGDEITMHRTDPEITPLQEQVLIGKLLGDGSIHETHNTAAVHFSHKKEHLDYLKWTLGALGDLANNKISELTSGYGVEMARASTTYTYEIKNLTSLFRKKDQVKKEVSEELVELIGPIALAFWYMDDGSLGHHLDQEDRANFAVCNFSEESCSNLLKALFKFGIKGIFFESKNCSGKLYSRLRLNSREAEKLFLLIAPYIPPVMQYKLPERYRNLNSGWMPQAPETQYKSRLVKQKIIEITSLELEESLTKYDITTETGNYFANGVLVHNSNSRFVFRDGQMHCGSRTEWKKEYTTPPNVTLEKLISQTGDELKAKQIYEKVVKGFRPKKSNWWSVIETYPQIKKFCEEHPGYCIFGEIFGNVKNFRYGAQNGQFLFRAFDILIPNDPIPRWMDAQEFIDTCDKYEIPRVPLLAVMPYDFENLVAMAEGNTTIGGATHIREGIVVKSEKERWSPELGRVSLKIINPKFLEIN